MNTNLVEYRYVAHPNKGDVFVFYWPDYAGLSIRIAWSNNVSYVDGQWRIVSKFAANCRVNFYPGGGANNSVADTSGGTNIARDSNRNSSSDRARAG